MILYVRGSSLIVLLARFVYYWILYILKSYLYNRVLLFVSITLVLYGHVDHALKYLHFPCSLIDPTRCDKIVFPNEFWITQQSRFETLY